MTTVTVMESLIRLSRSAVVGGFVLVASNLIPLAGVLWWGWDAYVIVFLYWLENGVIGVVNILKIRREEAVRKGTGHYLSNFFVLHYGIFWGAHGLLIVLLTGYPDSDFTLPRISTFGVGLALAALAVSHVGNYLFVFLREHRYEHTDPMRQTLSPYPRLITLHVVLILGAIMAGFLGQPAILIIMLVLFKLAFEIAIFVYQREVRVEGPTATELVRKRPGRRRRASVPAPGESSPPD